MHTLRSFRKLEAQLDKIEKRKQKTEEQTKKQMAAPVQQSAVHTGNDHPGWSDYYKMAASEMAYPPRLFAYGSLITSLLFFTPSAFEFVPVVQRWVPYNWVAFIVLLVAVHAIIVLFAGIRAIRLWYIFRRLPFQLNGLGSVVHSCEGPYYFRKCALHIVWDQSKKQLYHTVIDDIENNTLIVIADQAQATVHGKPISEKWSVRSSAITGFANWNVSRKILICLFRYLAPLQHETGIIRSIELTIPDPGNTGDNYYEWSPEGD